jgi:peptidoglycan hydrolase CwlO-like protein
VKADGTPKKRIGKRKERDYEEEEKEEERWLKRKSEMEKEEIHWRSQVDSELWKMKGMLEHINGTTLELRKVMRTMAATLVRMETEMKRICDEDEEDRKEESAGAEAEAETRDAEMTAVADGDGDDESEAGNGAKEVADTLMKE